MIIKEKNNERIQEGLPSVCSSKKRRKFQIQHFVFDLDLMFNQQDQNSLNLPQIDRIQVKGRSFRLLLHLWWFEIREKVKRLLK